MKRRQDTAGCHRPSPIPHYAADYLGCASIVVGKRLRWGPVVTGPTKFCNLYGVTFAANTSCAVEPPPDTPSPTKIGMTKSFVLACQL